jgi:YfiH family protein
VNVPPFLRSAELAALGIEHGFGTRASEAAKIPELRTVRQVHGRRVLRVPPHSSDLEADALVTTRPGWSVAVRTADCVPILLADRARRGVAAVHAGWRGSAARIAEHAVGALCEAIDAAPDELLAVIGPHIASCCYEVDEPVRDEIAEESVFVPAQRPGHYWLDLERLNRLQLERAGLRSVANMGGCTCCDSERYSSYRRDGTGGRMISYIKL